jgi:hypothetical protein
MEWRAEIASKPRGGTALAPPRFLVVLEAPFALPRAGVGRKIRAKALKSLNSRKENDAP